MTSLSAVPAPPKGEFRRFVRFLAGEFKPRGPWLTWFNAISIPILLASVAILVARFALGLGAVTNLSQDYPWGIWKAFNVVTGVAFAGGAYVLVFLVYILGQERFRPIVRITILNGFLAYVFYAGALLLELGRPWNVINPIIGNSFGFSSVLFLVAWHFLLYMIAQFVEFSPAVAEWLGWRRVHKVLHSMTLGAVIVGISLSMLHQSGLGALFLMAEGKIHPLWYSEFIPIQFLVSSVFAGLSMVILEGTLSRRVFKEHVSPAYHFSHERIVLTLSKICAGAMFVYLFLEALVFVHGRDWRFAASGWGAWYALEVLGLVAVPCALFAFAWRTQSTTLARVAAIVTIAGIVLNRLNVSLVAYNIDAAVRYVPTWMEVVVALGVICAQIWVFRWIVQRLPVLHAAPGFETEAAPRELARPEGRLNVTKEA